MAIFRYSDPARIVRRVSVSSAGVIVIVDDIGPWFASQLIDRKGGHTSDDPSPRNRPAKTLRYQDGVMGPIGARLTAGNRVGVGSVTYELLQDPKEVTDGLISVAWEVPVLPVEELYPLEGELQEQGGESAINPVRFSLYTPSETHGDRGTYENGSGECPIDLHTEVRTNRQFVAGGKTYKIISATVDHVGKFCALELRKAGRG